MGRVAADVLVLTVRPVHNPELPPIAHLLVERRELKRLSPNNEATESSLELCYQLLGTTRGVGISGCFGAHYMPGRDGAKTRLTTAHGGMFGAVFLDLPGLEGNRIGTYLMNEIVLWAKQWPDASIGTIELTSGQAGDSNRERRNRFYEQFNIEFDYDDEEHRSGKSRPLKAAQLTTTDAWQRNITLTSVVDFVNDTLKERELQSIEIGRLTPALAYVKRHLAQAEARPFRFALQRLWWGIAGNLSWIALVLIAAGFLYLRFW